MDVHDIEGIAERLQVEQRDREFDRQVEIIEAFRDTLEPYQVEDFDHGLSMGRRWAAQYASAIEVELAWRCRISNTSWKVLLADELEQEVRADGQRLVGSAVGYPSNDLKRLEPEMVEGIVSGAALLAAELHRHDRAVAAAT